MKTAIYLTAILCLMLLQAPLQGQSEKADQLVMEGNKLIDNFKEAEALQKFLEALKIDPGHFEALTQTSLMYSREGFREEDEEKKKSYYRKGADYAQKALDVDEASAEANFVMSVAKGRMAQILPTKEKIAASIDVKHYAEMALKYDKTHAGAWHVLGKWHYGVKELGATKMFLIKAIYGGLPNASYETALECFNKAIRYQPEYILYYLDLAKTYLQTGEENRARTVLERASGLDPATQDGERWLKEIEKHLAELK